MSKSKAKDKPDCGAQQALLDTDQQLQEAADAYGTEESDGTLGNLREAALAFAEAWRACGSKP